MQSARVKFTSNWRNLSGMVGKYLIYGLVDPASGQLRYIGKSEQGHNRAPRHWDKSALSNPKDKSHCANWVRKLVKEGRVPGIVLIQDFGNYDKEVLGEAEDFWITYFKAMGCQLTNLRRGGISGAFSEESKKHMSEAQKNSPKARVATLANLEKAHAAQIGRPRTQETREKIAAGHRGRPLTEKHRLALCKPKSRQGAINISRAHGGFPVRETTTSRIFDSLSAAVRELGLNYGNAHQVLIGKRNFVKGFHFEAIVE